MNRTEADSLKRIPLTPLRISNGALGSENLPTRLKLLNWGTNDSVKGPVVLDDKSVAVFAANQKALGFDRVAIDYEHNTAPGSEAYKESKEPRPVAGYGTPKLLSGDGLYLEDISWTPSGKTDAKNFADLSPAPRLDKEGRVLFLHSTALCRNGAVYDLSFFSADSTADPALNHNDMTPKEIADAISAALLPVTNQLTTLAADITTLKAAKPAEPTITLSVNDKPVVLSFTDVANRMLTAEGQVATLLSTTGDKEKGELIARFAAEGKVPMDGEGKAMTDDALKLLTVPTLKMILANTPATVPLSARGKKPAQTGGTGDLTGVSRVGAAWAHLNDN